MLKSDDNKWSKQIIIGELEKENTDRGKLTVQRVASIAEAELKADWAVGNPEI